ncbi:MAG: hypothetical protein PHX34_05670 [Candidatus Shapirobacteria bacterium]|nr:hypothetical protein [Candidatus Shapirobacteria bacterium]
MFSREDSTKDKCIGLFGSCGVSEWRKSFIEVYTKRQIPFFNSKVGVDQWQPELSIGESYHLANDRILLLAITKEEYSLGSLCELGFILNTLRNDKTRFCVVLIEPFPYEELKKDLRLYQESIKQRRLVVEHIQRLHPNNLYLVHHLDEMLDISLKLYQVIDILSTIPGFCLH